MRHRALLDELGIVYCRSRRPLQVDARRHAANLRTQDNPGWDWAPSKTGLRWAPASGLPWPVSPLVLGPRQRCRYDEHYQNTLASDLLYLTYDHELACNPASDPHRLDWDALDPYTTGRPPMPIRGSTKSLVPKARPVEPASLTRLNAIVVHIHEPSVIQNKSNLLPILTALQAMTGASIKGKGSSPDDAGIEVVLTTQSAKRHGARPGIPCGAKVRLTGQDMHIFLETLIEIVMPRIRAYIGVRMPRSPLRPSANSASGVVSIGFLREAMALFPQIEVNMQQYPFLTGFHVSFVTTARGPGAQDRARSLLSGFRIPVCCWFPRIPPLKWY